MYNDRMKAQGYSDKAGKYTATGFVPSRNSTSVQDSDNGSGCLSSLLTICIIVLIVSWVIV